MSLFDLIGSALPVLLMILAVLSIVFSKSKRNYNKLVDSRGLEEAEKTVKIMKRGGYILFSVSIVWLVTMLLNEIH